MIDTHCHIDMYNNPLEIAKESERLGIITIGMTNLPSHFELGYEHLLSFTKVRLALGMHPLYAEQHLLELPKFIKNVSNTSYIGEIGLDFSREGIATKDQQLSTFTKILQELKGKHKIISLHSRKAEKQVLQLLIEHRIQNAIFHWYSGPVGLINEIVEAGYYFSVNPAMIKSKSGQEIIKRIPKDYLLTESDGPYIEKEGIPIKPKDVKDVHAYLAGIFNVSELDIQETITRNFRRLLNAIR
jgi:TatD DNase family protein